MDLGYLYRPWPVRMSKIASMSYAGRPVLVAGAGVAGAAAARALLRAGAEVTVVDREDTATLVELAAAGARTAVGDGLDLLGRVRDVMVSPGFAPHHPLAAAAVRAGLDVYSEPELAWRLRGPDAPTWLAITGTNGKTTTTTMLASILAAAGLRTAALGNIGQPLVEAHDYDVIAVELSSFQLHWSRELAPPGAALLNLADDHLEWHGDFARYAEAKTRIWRSAMLAPAPPAQAPGPSVAPSSLVASLLSPDVAGPGAAVGNLDDPRVAALLATVPNGIGFTVTAEPEPGQLGVVDGVLVDASGAALIEAARIRPPGAHNVANALAAAALARWFGVAPEAVRAGLAGYRPEPHRNAWVATVGGVDYVDDSKATNPHAALASLLAYPRLVWVAGGQLKDVDPDDLVARVADRLVGAVLLGIDRSDIAEALARHAPQVPVIDIPNTDDGAMAEVVRAAAGLARPGDTVLLAPAAASLDMFTSYSARGEAFAAAVRGLS